MKRLRSDIQQQIDFKEIGSLNGFKEDIAKIFTLTDV